MALKHYKGGDVPQEQRREGPPPPPPAPRPQPAPSREAPQAAAVGPLEPPEPPDPDRVHIVVEHGHIRVDVEGASIEEAVQAAAMQYEAAQPIKALLWQDGTAVEGFAREVLLAAMDTYQQFLGAEIPPAVRLQLGRLRGALGVEAEDA